MTYQDKIKKIQKITEKTQVELADLFNVSFPTLNSWILGKSEPRKSAKELVDTIFQEYTGIGKTVFDSTEKQKQVLEFQKKYKNPLKHILSRPDIYDQFLTELTYHTNSIEGSTFKEPEVRAVLFNNESIPNRTLLEHQEVKNHQAALGVVMMKLKDSPNKNIITEELIKEIHKILMNGILENAGNYRNHAVRITGSYVATSNYLSISKDINEFIKKISSPEKNTIEHISKMHALFEKIHPFSDGNGRIGRLIMVIMSLQNNLAPIIIKRNKKYAYYNFLQQAQLKENNAPLILFIYDALLEGYKIIDLQ